MMLFSCYTALSGNKLQTVTRICRERSQLQYPPLPGPCSCTGVATALTPTHPQPTGRGRKSLPRWATAEANIRLLTLCITPGNTFPQDSKLLKFIKWVHKSKGLTEANAAHSVKEFESIQKGTRHRKGKTSQQNWNCCSASGLPYAKSYVGVIRGRGQGGGEDGRRSTTPLLSGILLGFLFSQEKISKENPKNLNSICF